MFHILSSFKNSIEFYLSSKHMKNNFIFNFHENFVLFWFCFQFDISLVIFYLDVTVLLFITLKNIALRG